MCLWYGINFLVSTLAEYYLFRPYSHVLWSGLYMFEAVCIFIVLIFLYARWLFKFNIPLQVLGHFGGLVLYFLLMGSLSYYFDFYQDGFRYFDDWKQYMTELLSWDALRFHDQYIITVAVFYIIRYFESLQKKEKEKSELDLKNKEMQLNLLRSQINPHFLFNTLNSISTLMNTSKEKARKMITQLSDIFRYALDSHGGEEVKLIHELTFIENFIRIQQVRFGERLKYITHVEPECLGVGIPPMILQPLVENSVKYGIAPKDSGGTIELTVKRNREGFFFEVKDDGMGTNAKKVLDGEASTGVGLKNSDRRLRSMYGDSAGLYVDASTEGYIVSFTLPDKIYKLSPSEERSAQESNLLQKKSGKQTIKTAL